MARQSTPSPVSPEALALGYQPEAVRARGLLIFLVLFALSIVILQGAVWLALKAYESRTVITDVPRSIVPSESDRLPPGPNLQPSVAHDNLDYQDLEALRTREDEVFAKLGWKVDRQTHAVTLPPELIAQVAADERARAAGPYVPPTTTGKETNSIVPGGVPADDTRPGIRGGQRP